MPDPPEGHKGPRDHRTRRERLAKDDPALEPTLPFHPDLQAVIDMLYDLGPTAAGEVVGWPDIEAWSRRTARDLPPWLNSLLRNLSAEFVSERQAAKAPGRRKPEPEVTEGQAQALARADARVAQFMALAAAHEADAAAEEAKRTAVPQTARRARRAKPAS